MIFVLICFQGICFGKALYKWKSYGKLWDMQLACERSLQSVLRKQKRSTNGHEWYWLFFSNHVFCLSISLSLCLIVCLSVCLPASHSLSVCLTFCWSLVDFFSVCLSFIICLFGCLLVSVCFFVCLPVIVYLSVWLSVGFCLSISLFVSLSACLS